MAERPTFQKELYPYMAAGPRVEYEKILTREKSAFLYTLIRDQIEKMMHQEPNPTWGLASSIDSRTIEKGDEHILRVSNHVPVHDSELLQQEDDEKFLLYQEGAYAFNSVARITQREFSSGTFLSKTEVVIRDFPPDLTQPIVNQYRIEQYRSGFVYGHVEHTRPMLLDKEVQREVRSMVAYDFGALAIDLDRIHAMRLKNQPAHGLSSGELI